MSLIDKTYFVHDINIPDDDYEALAPIITRYEKEILISLFGYALWKLINAYNSGTSPQRIKDIVEGKEYTVSGETIKWNGLQNTDKISLIAYYVFYWYLRNETTRTSTLGEVGSKNENAIPASPAQRLSGAWHRLRELYGFASQDSLIASAYNFMTEHESNYDEWVFTDIGTVNSFDVSVYLLTYLRK